MKNAKHLLPLTPLLQRARQEDEAAIQELLALYRPQIRRWVALRRGPNGIGIEGVSDITQGVMTRAYEGLASFDGADRAAWECWLRAILDQTIADICRRGSWKKRNAWLLPLDNCSNPPAQQSRPSQRIARRQELMRTLQLISRLPRMQGQAIWLRHREGHTVSEIAGILGRTNGAVSSLIWRGLAELANLRGEGGLRQRAAESRLDRAVGHYLELFDCGNAPPLDQLIAQYPDCASDLRLIVKWILDLDELKSRDGTQSS